ncbi:unnamed protein product [Dicrocoelium dendriticum]|nr:unnamed protein product [Dicrocoelium dendriticum]
MTFRAFILCYVVMLFAGSILANSWWSASSDDTGQQSEIEEHYSRRDEPETGHANPAKRYFWTPDDHVVPMEMKHWTTD